MSGSFHKFALEAVMPISILQSILLGILIIVIVAFLIAREVFRPVDKRSQPGGRKWRLPPGPVGWPIVGNLWKLQAGGPPEARELAKYGEMTTLHLGSKTWVVLNSNRVANEIYNRRGALTNGRPHLPVVSGLISHDRRSVWLPVAEWSERRRVMQQLLSGSAMNKYAEFQELESAQLLAEYLYHPDTWYLHNGRYSNSVIHRIALGKRVDEFDKNAADIFRVQSDFVLNGPPMNTIDCFPALSKLPRSLQWWRKAADRIGQTTYEVYSRIWAPLQAAVAAGEAGPSFARDVLVGEDAKFSGTEEDSMYLSLQLIEAGSDTTRASLNLFAMAAVRYPDVYQKVRSEIDQICGPNAERLPTFADESNMPYVMAFIKELVRWRPIFMWTPEHTLTEDLEFEGYSFPKGVSFVLNHSVLSTDPAEFEDADVLRPERWLGEGKQDILKGLWVFGGGRRVCVGYRLAQRSLLINIARIVYCYDFKATGPIDDNKINHFTLDAPIPVLPLLRSKQHEELIIQSADALGVLKFVNNQ